MLVLTRKSGESIVINDNIQVFVRRISGNRVTLGVEAPDDVRIVRSELGSRSREFATDEDRSTGNCREFPKARSLPLPVTMIASETYSTAGASRS